MKVLRTLKESKDSGNASGYEMSFIEQGLRPEHISGMFFALNELLYGSDFESSKMLVKLGEELRKAGVDKRAYFTLMGRFTFRTAKDELEVIRDKWIEFYDRKEVMAMMRGEDLKKY